MNLDSLSKVIEVHKKLLNLKSPLGSKESPARSCLDLFLDDSEISDGMLFINNQSSKSTLLQVLDSGRSLLD